MLSILSISIGLCEIKHKQKSVNYLKYTIMDMWWKYI